MKEALVRTRQSDSNEGDGDARAPLTAKNFDSEEASTAALSPANCGVKEPKSGIPI